MRNNNETIPELNLLELIEVTEKAPEAEQVNSEEHIGQDEKGEFKYSE